MSEHLSGTEIAEAFAKELEIQVIYNAVDDATYQKFEFPKAHEIANMFQFFRCSDEFKSKRKVESCVKVMCKETSTFSQWLKENKSSIPIDK